jgi:hypothetical protein
MKSHPVAANLLLTKISASTLLRGQIMFIQRLTQKLFTVIITVIALGATTSNAAGPEMVELSHTVEEARISITMSENGQSGTLTARLLECSGCTPKDYTFNNTTILINQFGAERPIEELKTWGGNRAMFHYLKANNQIEQIHILP